MSSPGTYLGKFLSAVTTKTSTGNAQLAIDFEVSQVWDGEWVESVEGKKTVFLSLTDNAWPYTEGKLQASGFTGDFGKPDFSSDWKLSGQMLECGHEEYKGKDVEKWDFAQGQRAQAPDDMVRALTARWKSKNQKAAPPAGRPTPPKLVGTTSNPLPPAPEGVPVPNQEDIPF